MVAVVAGIAACPTPAERPASPRRVSPQRRSTGPTCLIQNIAPPERLAVDRQQLFWINGRGEVKAIAKAGGAPRTLASGQIDLHDLALDADRVYWLAFDAVRSVAKSGGPVQTIAPTGPGPHKSYFEDIVVVGRTVLWTAPLVHQVMMRDPKQGAVVTAAFVRQVQPERLAADQESLYVWSTGTVVRIDRASGAPQTVISSPGRVSLLRVDRQELFWSEQDGRLMTSTVGGDPRVLVPGQQSISGLALDADCVYWTDQAAGKVLQVPRAGGDVVVLATGQPGPSDLVLDPHHLYWSNSGGKGKRRGALMRLKRRACPRAHSSRRPQSRPVVSPTRSAPPVSATLQVTSPLCIRTGARPELVGGVRVELKNLTASEVRVYSEDHNSLVFESVRDGSLHVVVHECACVQNARPEGSWLELGAKETRVKSFDDWTHDGGAFPTIPPGEYRLSFRFFLRPRPHLAGGRDACRKELQSAAYWRGALGSNAVPVNVGWGRCRRR